MKDKKRDGSARRERSAYAMKVHKECVRIRRIVVGELLPLTKRTLRELKSLERSVSVVAGGVLNWRALLDE